MIKEKDFEIFEGNLKISEGRIEIGHSEFLRRYLVSVKIPDSVTRIGFAAFQYNKLTSVEIPNSVKEIESCAFEDNQLTSIKISDGVYKIGEGAFSENQLTSVKIPNSVKEIGEGAFAKNQLTSVEIPNGVSYIGDRAFQYNKLTSVKIPSSVALGTGAFSDNQLTSIEISDGVSYIGDWVFAHNQLTSVEIPNSVKEIGSRAFASNQLTSVEIPNSVKKIGEGAFASNQLTSIKISDGVSFIGDCVFAMNQLTSVEIPNSVKEICSSAFSENQLTSVEIPNGVSYIGDWAFEDNQLTSVEIPNSVKKIGEGAFASNQLKSVKVPGSVVDIEDGAFDNIDVIYNGVLISKNYVEKYGCENIIKLYEASKIIPLEKIYENISKVILYVLPITNDAIKGYILNKGHFEEFIEDKEIKDEEYQDIFKMCFALGLFSKPDEEVIRFIRQIKEEKTEDYIHQMWTAVKLSTYKPKFKDLFMKLYNEGKTDYEGQNIIGRLYSSFERIAKYTIKRHEKEISKKNTEIKRLKELGANTTLLERELESLKKNKKNIEYEDITYYIKNNAFVIREGNEELESVVDTLSVHMEQEEFDIIQDMYEESLEVEKTIPLTKDTSDKDFKYHWSKSANPINTILGYIVDCCAKLGGAGKDIMRQSMINPDVANLIIYDENNNIIGKATAYYNKSEKYILFNNAETKEIVAKGLKSAKQRQKECLEALIRGAIDATRALKERGEDINEVRIGMLRNDLECVIKDCGLEISHKLLKSYNWQGYIGDASDIKKGQAIIYKDEEVYNKSKDHI